MTTATNDLPNPSPVPIEITNEENIVYTIRRRIKCERCDTYTTLKLIKVAEQMICNDCVLKNFNEEQKKEKTLKRYDAFPFHTFEINEENKEKK